MIAFSSVSFVPRTVVDTLEPESSRKEHLDGWVWEERKKAGKKSDLTSRWVVFNSGYTWRSRELSVLVFTECNTHNEKSPSGAAWWTHLGTWFGSSEAAPLPLLIITSSKGNHFLDFQHWRWDWAVFEIYITGGIRNVLFSVWLLSLNIMHVISLYYV